MFDGGLNSGWSISKDLTVYFKVLFTEFWILVSLLTCSDKS